MIKAIKRWWFTRRVRSGVRALKQLDVNMAKAGITRRERRRFWREYFKHQEVRNELLKGL